MGDGELCEVIIMNRPLIEKGLRAYAEACFAGLDPVVELTVREGTTGDTLPSAEPVLILFCKTVPHVVGSIYYADFEVLVRTPRAKGIVTHLAAVEAVVGNPAEERVGLFDEANLDLLGSTVEGVTGYPVSGFWVGDLEQDEDERFFREVIPVRLGLRGGGTGSGSGDLTPGDDWDGAEW